MRGILRLIEEVAALLEPEREPEREIDTISAAVAGAGGCYELF